MRPKDRIDRVRRRVPLLDDALLAAVVAAVTLVAVVVESQQDDMSLPAWGIGLIAVQVVPLVWRRRAPCITATVSLVACMVYGMAELPDPPLMFAALLAIYTVAAHRPRSVAVPSAAVTMLLGLVSIWFGDPSDAADVTVGYFSGITAWLVGDTTRGQRERAVWLDARRADSARQAATDERVRIARDLHDVVAHHVSVIAVQAEAAQEVLAGQPERAGESMARVADTARTALVELRRLLGVLRSHSDLAPQPDLATVDDLVDSVRRTGVAVTLRRSEAPDAVDPVVGMTAYRVIQEALTNVIKHAGPCQAHVALDYEDDVLLVSVHDDGVVRRDHLDGTGQGLVGMRERVAMLGGSLRAGPGESGGFAVEARLPLGAGAA